MGPPSLDPVCVRSGDGILEVALVIHRQMLVATLTVIETQKLALINLFRTCSDHVDLPEDMVCTPAVGNDDRTRSDEVLDNRDEGLS